jgi:hypothetical protein
VTQEEVDNALELFGLTRPISRAQLDEKRHELLAIWHPPRYANMTNNPRKYMQMYKKGEAMTRAVHTAYDLLVSWLESGKGAGR